MIRAAGMTARSAGVELSPLTLELGAGRHAIVGGSADGPAIVLACIAGDVRPRRGSLTVLDGPPHDARVRRRVAYVPLMLSLPDVLRVRELLEMAWRLRGEAPMPAAKEALALLGLESLLDRRVRSLDGSEARAVALAEGLAAKKVSVLVVEEPFVAMAPSAAAALSDAIAGAERAGRCVVVSSASARDAARVANNFVVLERGRVLRAGRDALGIGSGKAARMRVSAADGRALAATLARQANVTRLELVEGALVVSGRELGELAGAVNAAILEAGVAVTRIESEPA